MASSASVAKGRLSTMWLAAALCATPCWGNVKLPRLVGDHMVLQRDSKISVWGWADPAEKLQISFHGTTVRVHADQEGRWMASIGPFKGGGPYEMTIAGKNRITLRDVLIGDVWIASGQSNMEFPLQADKDSFGGVINADREIADATYPQLRLFKLHHNIAFRPEDDVDADGWTAVTPDTVATFSALAYLFGREIHRRYDVPVGLIQTSWGGTVAEAWVSTAGLSSFPEFESDVKAVQQTDVASIKAEYERYLKAKADWHEQHSAEDRGKRDGHPIWADPSLDVSAWPSITEPQSEADVRLKGFDGVVWFRREIMIPAEKVGKRVRVHLSAAGKTDTTYFNGKEIGRTEGWDKPRSYVVPAGAIKAGRNVIVIRMTGSGGDVGMLDTHNPDKLYVEVGAADLPLAGSWVFQPGPDLAEYPVPPTLWNQNKPVVLFNGMIHPLLPFRIRGVIWYQGESNASRPAQYRALFPSLIRDWRQHWGYSFPFLFVQLAGFGHNKPEPADCQWAELREAQHLALSEPLTGMATAVDIGDENDVHPRDKQSVAHRLVLAAAKVAYGEDIVYSGPTYRSIQIEGARVRVKFGHVGSGLVVKDKYGYIRGFEVAGAEGRYFWAQAQRDGQDVLVSSRNVSVPVAIRYNWSNTPDGNLFNREGLPAPPFRTDGPGH